MSSVAISASSLELGCGQLALMASLWACAGCSSEKAPVAERVRATPSPVQQMLLDRHTIRDLETALGQCNAQRSVIRVRPGARGTRLGKKLRELQYSFSGGRLKTVSLSIDTGSRPVPALKHLRNIVQANGRRTPLAGAEAWIVDFAGAGEALVVLQTLQFSGVTELSVDVLEMVKVTTTKPEPGTSASDEMSSDAGERGLVATMENVLGICMPFGREPSRVGSELRKRKLAPWGVEVAGLVVDLPWEETIVIDSMVFIVNGGGLVEEVEGTAVADHSGILEDFYDALRDSCRTVVKDERQQQKWALVCSLGPALGATKHGGRRELSVKALLGRGRRYRLSFNVVVQRTTLPATGTRSRRSKTIETIRAVGDIGR